MSQIIFVGERRSATARAKGWTWRDGRLAAKTLFEALRGIGVDPLAHDYVNLWPDDGVEVTRHRRARLRARARAGVTIVALGRLVAVGLSELGIAHVALIHPAARGTIRGRGRYAAHVATTLGPVIA